MTVAATGTLKATTELPRYGSWEGRPHPSILHFPDHQRRHVHAAVPGPLVGHRQRQLRRLRR